MRLICWLFVTLFGLPCWSHDHQHLPVLEAHVHGQAQLNWAFESKTQAEVEFRVDGHSVVGHERAAQTAAEQEAEKAALLRLQGALPAALSLAPELGCTWIPGAAHVHRSKSQHSEFVLAFKVQCKKSLQSTKIQVRLKKILAQLEELKVQLLGPTQQSSFKIAHGQGEIDFSKAF